MAFKRALAAAVLVSLACAGATAEDSEKTDASGLASMKPGSVEWKIATYTSAAPREVGDSASVLDWPDPKTGKMAQLRVASRNWVCMPGSAQSLNARSVKDVAPMCMDQTWLRWSAALQRKMDPGVKTVGVAYMLHGDHGASNTDPFAIGPTSSNAWVVSGPHLMIIAPDLTSLEGLPSDPAQGGPFVMWRGTPYAHIMVPISSHKP